MKILFNNTISQLGCPNEGNFRTIDGGCYLFINERKNYDDAKSLCKNKIANGRTGHLVEPKTSAINKLIHDEAKGFTPYYWIGLNDIENENNWVYTSTGLQATTTFFASSQPNADGDCVYVCLDDEWCDLSCEGTVRVICEF